MDAVEGFNKIKFTEIGSTNKESVRRILNLTALDKTIITSSIQTIGYGKGDRDWKSPIGNLYASLSLKVDLPFEYCKQYSFVMALSIRQVVSLLTGSSQVLCKWPNDVLVGGEKISGILLESLKDENNQKWLVIGFGINVNNSPEVSGKKVTSINKLSAKEHNLDNVLERTVYYFNYYVLILKKQGFEKIKEVFCKCCYKLNETIEVNYLNKKYKGKFTSIDNYGSLLLEVDGENMSFQSCDVVY